MADDRDDIDKLGQLDTRIKMLQAEYDELSKHVKLLGPGVYLGTVFKALVYTQKQTRLDLDAVREKLGAAWCAKHSKVTSSTYLRVGPTTDAINKIAAQLMA